jgi:aspartate/methionine/tyrosine aminotransferase
VKVNPVSGHTSSVTGDESLTADERRAQDISWNLADAHARQKMSGDERKEILVRFPRFFLDSATFTYSQLERDAALTFLHSLGQFPGNSTILSAYSSSVSTMIVARLLRQRQLDVSLTCPTFDNLFALLSAEGLNVKPRDVTNDLGSCTFDDTWPGCIFEVSPNNPTGHIICRAALTRLAQFCAETGRVLVLDQSFKGHVREACFDHYSVLEQSGADYIVIEDSGKLWPTLDLKVAFLVTSGRLGSELRSVVDDILLNVSPFMLQLVQEYARYSCREKPDYASVRGVIVANRKQLREEVSSASDLLTVAYPDSAVGVEVLDVAPAYYDHFMRALGERKVAVLPTDKFYWHRRQGAQPCQETLKSQIRIALCRDTDYLRDALTFLMEAVSVAREAPNHDG